MQQTGILAVLEALPSRPGLLVINHHRIGAAAESPFDRGVFSSTADELDSQLRYLKQRMPVVAGEELRSLVTGTRKLDRTYAVITFDDGYLDNFQQAFPILNSHGLPALFFLVTSFIGSALVPWWDEIAFLVRASTSTSISLRWPVPLTLSLANPDRERAIAALLLHYKRPDNTDPLRFLAELREQTSVCLPPQSRRFLDWSEITKMTAAGMEIGSHSVTHPLLSQLTADEQRLELTESKKILEQTLGGPVHSLAYPVGTRDALTPATEQMAQAAGYSLCFAFHGGINVPGRLNPAHLHRMSPAREPEAFRLETTLFSLFRRLPYT